MTKQPWYADGLRFTCHQCGNCCRNLNERQEFVYLTVADYVRIDNKLRFVDVEDFVEIDDDGDIRLKRKRNGDCIFLGGNTCTLHDAEAKPKQCRQFPFNPENITSDPLSWKKHKLYCKGIDDPNGRLYSMQEIFVGVEKTT
jgi:hypothetical protein